MRSEALLFSCLLVGCAGSKSDPHSPAQVQAEREVGERLDAAAHLLRAVGQGGARDGRGRCGVRGDRALLKRLAVGAEHSGCLEPCDRPRSA
jgi:hypothetical protein